MKTNTIITIGRQYGSGGREIGYKVAEHLKAKDIIIKTDKKRASYYNYYTNKKWSDAESYELCLNSGELGVEGTAQAIEQYVALKEGIASAKRKL